MRRLVVIVALLSLAACYDRDTFTNENTLVDENLSYGTDNSIDLNAMSATGPCPDANGDKRLPRNDDGSCPAIQ